MKSRPRPPSATRARDAKYPPWGVRGGCYLTRVTGFSARFTPGYWSEANENTMVVPLIENREAVESLEEILSVKGVDFVFFGARDFSISCGFPTVDNPETRKAKERVVEVCRERGVPLAHFLYPPFEESVRRAVDDGAKILVAGGDNALLYQACRSLVQIVDEARKT